MLRLRRLFVAWLVVFITGPPSIAEENSEEVRYRIDVWNVMGRRIRPTELPRSPLDPRFAPEEFDVQVPVRRISIPWDIFVGNIEARETFDVFPEPEETNELGEFPPLVVKGELPAFDVDTSDLEAPLVIGGDPLSPRSISGRGQNLLRKPARGSSRLLWNVDQLEIRPHGGALHRRRRLRR